MKIKSIAFKNNARPWELEKTNFSDLTLLVGASGVGKTQILNNIMKLVNISNGYVYNGVEWDFYFTGDNNENYRWTGQFESIKGIHQQVFQEKDINGQQLTQIPKLLKEKLYLENKLVFRRKESNVIYEKKEVPKISPYKSVLNLFTSEEKILPLKIAFRKIVFLDYQDEQRFKIPKEMIKEFGEFAEKSYKDSLKANIKKDEILKSFKEFFGNASSESLLKKLSKKETVLFFVVMEFVETLIFKVFLTYTYFNEIFAEIIADFKDIFPQVEDVDFKLLEDEEAYELQIKERETGWISMDDISSGMFKTLLHLAEIKLMANGFVILIDEFENSLGVNCIDAVANDLVDPGRNLQYLITSHHPYIINNIDMKYWKVVMRKGTKVSTKNVEQLNLGKSRHEAFKQLLNLEEFAEGIS